MINRDFNKYLDNISKYTKKVSSGEVTPEKYLESLVKAGICDKDKKLNIAYRKVALNSLKLSYTIMKYPFLMLFSRRSGIVGC